MSEDTEYTQVVNDTNVDVANIYQDDAGNYYFKDTFDYLPVNKMYIDEQQPPQRLLSLIQTLNNFIKEESSNYSQ